MTYPMFPNLAGMAIATRRSPVWRSSIQSTLSGKETRLAYMSYPLYNWTVDFNALRSYSGYAELAQMIGFLNTLQGMALPFLYTDAEDNAVTAQPFGTGDGTKVSFQLVRSYGGYSEPVQQPEPIGLMVYVNGVRNTSVSLGANGVVTFASAPASGAVLTWTGAFYFLCRMLQDNPEFGQEHINIWSLKSLSFQSVKL